LQQIAAILIVAAAVFGTACGKLGVGKPGSGGGSTSAAIYAPPAEPTPNVRITTPARGSFLAVGQAAVEGQVTAVTGTAINSVQLNGQTVTLDGAGKFRGFVRLDAGMNVIEASATDSSGRLGTASSGVLAGDYSPVSQNIPQAAAARITDPTLLALGKIAEAALWQTDWTTVLKGLNPIFDTNFLWIDVWIDIQQVRFRDVFATIDSNTSGLGVTIDVFQPIFDVTIVVDLGLGKIGPVAAVVEADSARLTTNAALSVRPDGSFATTTTPPVTTFQNFRMSVQNGALDLAIQLFAKNAIANALKDWLHDAIVNDLPPYFDKTMATFLNQQKPFTFLGKSFSFDLRGERIAFDDDGFSLSVKYNASHGSGLAVQRALAAPGSFSTPGAMPTVFPVRGLYVCGDDDAINRTFHALWAGGLFNIDIDQTFLTTNNITLPIALEAASLRRFMPEIGAVVPDSAPVKLRTEALLPPIVKITGSPDVAVLQAGEYHLEILVDRGQGFEKLLRAAAHMEIGGNLTLTTNGLEVSSLSSPRFRFDLIEEPMIELDDRRLEVLLSVLLTPTIPHMLNSLKVINVPHLNQLTTVNVDVYRDGPAGEHVTVAGELVR
jgi:hypothetical protein